MSPVTTITTAHIHPTAIIDEGVRIGDGTRVWHFSHLSTGCTIGQGCSIGQNVYIAPGVRIGSNVKIQNNVSVYEGVELEDDVFCGPSMVFTNVITPRSAFPRKGKEHYSRTIVRRGATIGANATIVCGNTIGECGFVGAGAVVTRDVPNYAIVVGNPARVVGYACQCGARLLLEAGGAYCTGCTRTYRSIDGRLRARQ
jgi:UDP-2-acetamido-3-amino-2,3-dideoxy-glucuronate N-acetyltransferase